MIALTPLTHVKEGRGVLDKDEETRDAEGIAHASYTLKGYMVSIKRSNFELDHLRDGYNTLKDWIKSVSWEHS